jgi:hypothetical protein
MGLKYGGYASRGDPTTFVVGTEVLIEGRPWYQLERDHVSIDVKGALGHYGVCTPGIDERPGWAFPAPGGEPTTGGSLESLTVANDSRHSANAH